jgi:hypothetical protein
MSLLRVELWIDGTVDGGDCTFLGGHSTYCSKQELCLSFILFISI